MTRAVATMRWLAGVRIALLCACFVALLPSHPAAQGAPLAQPQTQADNCDGETVSAVAAPQPAKRLAGASHVDDGIPSRHPRLSPSERHGVSLPTACRNVEPRRATNTARGPPVLPDAHPTIRTT
jgi:hypothetical protein